MLRKRWKRQIFSMILAIVLALGEIPVPAQVAYAAEISEGTEKAEAAVPEGTFDGGEEEEAEIAEGKGWLTVHRCLLRDVHDCQRKDWEVMLR